jgi:competence protein ComEA
MFKKVVVLIAILSISLFAIDVSTASKAELMSIKGIGEKKADAIIEYRKSNEVKSADDLRGVKGIGASIIDNIKKGIKVQGSNKTKSTTSTNKVDNKKEDKDKVKKNNPDKNSK